MRRRSVRSRKFLLRSTWLCSSRRRRAVFFNFLPLFIGLILYSLAYNRWRTHRPRRIRMVASINEDEENILVEREIFLASRYRRLKDINNRDLEVFFIHEYPKDDGVKKVVGLVELRNGGRALPVFLKELSRVVDSIVILDDVSTDESREVIFGSPFKTELLINKSGPWVREELRDRNILLQYGRQVGGTQFVLLDYDEYFADACVRDGRLKEAILSLSPGQSIYLPWIETWEHSFVQRVVPGDREMNFLTRRQSVIFADDGKTRYDEQSSLSRSVGRGNASIHALRCPRTICPAPPKYSGPVEKWTFPVGGKVKTLERCSILEFRFLNLPNVLLKSAWYEALGRVSGAEDGRTSGKMLDALFPTSSDRRSPASVSPATARVPLNYIPESLRDELKNPYKEIEAWRAAELLQWRHIHGKRTFDNLTANSQIDFTGLNSALSSAEKGEIVGTVPRNKKGTVVLIPGVASGRSEHPLSIVLKAFQAHFVDDFPVYGASDSELRTDANYLHAKEYQVWKESAEAALHVALGKSPCRIAVHEIGVSDESSIRLLIHFYSRDVTNLDIAIVDGGQNGLGELLNKDAFASVAVSPASNVRYIRLQQGLLASLAGISLLRSRVLPLCQAVLQSGESFVSTAEKISTLVADSEKPPVARLVFSNNAGRSGSAYLAKVLSTGGQGVVALHEPRCPENACSGGGAYPMQRHTLSATYNKRKAIKLPMIRAELARMVQDGPSIHIETVSCDILRSVAVRDRQMIELGSHGCYRYRYRDFVYAETNPNFKSWIFDIVLDTFPGLNYDVRVINLRKYLPAVVRSLYETGFFTTRDGYSWLETANSVNSRVVPLGPDEKLSAIDKLISYAVNAEAVTQYIKRRYASVPNVRFLDTRSEVIFSREGLLSLLRDIGVQPGAETLKAAGMHVDKYDYADRKALRGRTVPHKSLKEVEGLVRQYLTRFRKRKGSDFVDDMPQLQRVKGFDYRD